MAAGATVSCGRGGRCDAGRRRAGAGHSAGAGGYEWAHTACSELRIVETMHERKRLMAEHSDAFLALPGGIGSFEEFSSMSDLAAAGLSRQAGGLLNHHGYYDAAGVRAV